MPTDSTRPMSRDASKILAEQFAKGLETTSSLLHRLQSEVHAGAVTLATMRTEVTQMHTELDVLSKIIRDGNGERSLVARIMLLETAIDKLKGEKEEAYRAQQESISINNKGKWQMKVALITSGLAFIGTVVSAILNFLGN